MFIEINGLTKTFISRAGSFEAVKNVNMSVAQGDYVCIAGRSGSGKSTLLNMMTGLIKPTSGSILMGGEELLTKSDAEFSCIRNRDMSYMMQGLGLLGNLTLLENVVLPAQIYAGGEANAEERARALLEQVGLGDKAGNYPSQLSGGEARRGMIARALINKPKLFISDEPTDGLDEETADSVMTLFDEIHKDGVTFIVVSHEAHFKRLARSVYMMRAGCLSPENEVSTDA